jgi:succinate dehydrogenase/fumarate reductase flavoprotein subunit
MNALDNSTCDVLVVGSGAAGMMAAITARKHGLDVLVVEKAACVGGTTAISGGSLWVPANEVSTRAGIRDSAAAARSYLQANMGDRFDPTVVDRFLDVAPKMVSFLERETAVRFYCQNDFPDFMPQLPGGLAGGGRTICSEPFYARALGEHVAKLPLPLYTQTALGVMTTPRDLKHFQNFTRSLRSFGYVGKRMLQHQRDMLFYGRTMWLTNGNSLVARLMQTMIDLGVELRLSTPAIELLEVDGAVRGACVVNESGPKWITARRGVVLASGGFGHDPESLKRWLPRPALDGEDWSMAAPGHTGDAIRMGERVGARVGPLGANVAQWAPVSRVPTLDGMLHGHYCCRSKPPVFAVTPNGQRFANESDSFHHFCENLIRATPPGKEAIAYLVTDHAGILRYGLGAVMPRPFPLAPHLKSGYLLRGESIAELARHAGIETAALERTLEEYNRIAATGHDPHFGKGSTESNRHYGSSTNPGPNPCLAPLGAGPFYAVKMTVGQMGTMVGLHTDTRARVLSASGECIPGLYAVGEASAQPLGGTCPSAGVMLSTGMTFGFIAGQDLAAQAAAPARAASGTAERSLAGVA